MRRSLLLLAVLGLLSPASVDASQPAAGRPEPGTMPEVLDRAVDRGRIDRLTADLHLAAALAGEPVPPRYRGTEPWDGTLVLLELQERLESMPPGGERRALRTAVHPTSGGAGADFCGVSVGPTTHTSLAAPHFYIEYNDEELGAGLGIAAYEGALETSWQAEVGAFGWAAPPAYPPNPAPGGRYHVRIQNLGPLIYGFVANSGTHAGLVGNNPNTPWNDGDAYASCMVLNSDYEPFPGTALQALQATAAHEFNHSLQFGYGALNGSNTPDAVFFEGGATWMEDEVFDGSNDNYNYLWPNLADDMGQHEGSPYRYWVVFRAMTERHGVGVGGGGERIMQRFWEITSKNQGDTLEALDKALQTDGTTLRRAFHEAAVAIRYSRSCGGGYVQPHCFEEGNGYTAAKGTPTAHAAIGGVGSSLSGTMPDNYSANFVDMPVGIGAVQMILSNTSPRAGRFTGSLVCDTGAGLRVSPFSGTAAGSQHVYVRRFETNGCVAASVVVVNVSQTAANPSSSADRPYSLRVTPPAELSKTKVRARAKGNKTVVRGRVRPPHRGGEVVLELFRKAKKKWKRSDGEVVRLKKGGKRFRTKMKRPNVRRCRVVATFAGDHDHLPSRARRGFRC